mgnify:CR=1 FL=1
MLSYLNSSFYLSFFPKEVSISNLSIKTGNTAVVVSQISGAGEVPLRSGSTGALVVVLGKAGLWSHQGQAGALSWSSHRAWPGSPRPRAAGGRARQYVLCAGVQVDPSLRPSFCPLHPLPQCEQVSTKLLLYQTMEQWHPTPVLLPGKSHGRRSLVPCSPWGR